MSTMYVNNIAPLEGNTINVASGKTLSAPGHVIQVVQVVKTDTYSMTAASWTDITGYSVSITPSSSSNKVLINYKEFFRKYDFIYFETSIT